MHHGCHSLQEEGKQKPRYVDGRNCVVWVLCSLCTLFTFLLVCLFTCILIKPLLLTADSEKGDRTSKQSDQTSNNDSDLKVDIRTASSLSNPPESEQCDDSSERITPRTLIANGEPIYRYGTDYADANFPPKAEGHNNNGYVPYVDYGRDYNPAFGHGMAAHDTLDPSSLKRCSYHFVVFTRFTATINNSQSSLYSMNPHAGIPLTGIDPRFSAAYGNPYLRSSTTSLPPPHLSGVMNYSSARNAPAPQVGPARTPPPPAAVPHSQYIVSNKAQLKPGTLATHV